MLCYTQSKGIYSAGCYTVAIYPFKSTFFGIINDISCHICNSWYLRSCIIKTLHKWFNLSSLIDRRILYMIRPLRNILFAAIIHRPLAFLPLNHMDTHTRTYIHRHWPSVSALKGCKLPQHHIATRAAAPLHVASLSLSLPHLNRKRCTFERPGWPGTKASSRDRWKVKGSKCCCYFVS